MYRERRGSKEVYEQLSHVIQRQTVYGKALHGLDGLGKLNESSQALVFCFLSRIKLLYIITVGVSPYTIITDQAVYLRILIGVKRGHDLGNDFLIIDQDVRLLRVHPGLSILVSIAKDGDFVIIHREFDMTISLFMHGVQGSDLVLAGIPVASFANRRETKGWESVLNLFAEIKTEDNNSLATGYSPINLEILILALGSQDAV